MTSATAPRKVPFCPKCGKELTEESVGYRAISARPGDTNQTGSLPVFIVFCLSCGAVLTVHGS